MEKHAYFKRNRELIRGSGGGIHQEHKKKGVKRQKEMSKNASQEKR